MKRWKAFCIGLFLWNVYISGVTFEELRQMLRARAHMQEDYVPDMIRLKTRIEEISAVENENKKTFNNDLYDLRTMVLKLYKD